MTNYDITLYGHLTIDTIFEGFQKKYSIGSIANVWKSLIQENPSLKINICPTEIGSAIIYVDKNTSERFSKASLSNFIHEPIILDSEINHILYLNELKNTTFISQLNGINCADVCVGKKIDYSLLQYIDYLFIADEDCDNYDELQKYIRGKVIVHSSTGSYWKDGSYNLPFEKILNNVNVLGAGDMFAANFMIGLLDIFSTFQDCIHLLGIIENAHLKTTERISYG